MREECLKLSNKEFLESEQYRDKQIWEIKYLSTSDEEDNDSSDEEESDS